MWSDLQKKKAQQTHSRCRTLVCSNLISVVIMCFCFAKPKSFLICALNVFLILPISESSHVRHVMWEGWVWLLLLELSTGKPVGPVPFLQGSFQSVHLFSISISVGPVLFLPRLQLNLCLSARSCELWVCVYYDSFCFPLPNFVVWAWLLCG